MKTGKLISLILALSVAPIAFNGCSSMDTDDDGSRESGPSTTQDPSAMPEQSPMPGPAETPRDPGYPGGSSPTP